MRLLAPPPPHGDSFLILMISGSPGDFILLHEYKGARLGLLVTRRGVIRTPHFAPVATRGTLKGVLPEDLPPQGYDLLLTNTYHLLIRPGLEVVERLGGVHRMIGWERAILSDSGGFQIYSLESLRTLKEEGVILRSYLDGAPLFLTPEFVVQAQERLGSDIAMVLDVCLPHPAPYEALKEAVELTLRWAERSLIAHRDRTQLLFGIVQGGVDLGLRTYSLERTAALPFEGFALGGLCVGEETETMYRVIEEITPALPRHRVRYLMGIGRPDNLVRSVMAGADLFDCVLPTRNARNGKLLTMQGFLNIQRQEFRDSTLPIEEDCPCPTCRSTTRGMLRYLYKIREFNYVRLATIHNLYFMHRLMSRIREAILHHTLEELKEEMEYAYPPVTYATRGE